MQETLAAFVLKEHLGPASFSPPLGPPGDARILEPNNQLVETADGWMTVTANTDTQVRGFLTAVGRTALIEDPRFCSVTARFRNVTEWMALRRAALKDQPTAHWVAAFAEADVPAAPCHTLEALIEDPHLRAVGLIRDELHDQEGAIRTIRPTILEDGEPAVPGAPARPIGWDTRAVLAEAGYTASEVEVLIANGAARASA
jgi:crotonobetainyl-CoA:carnitine CoA-transferase CaiB-like acyl-CoA transferase